MTPPEPTAFSAGSPPSLFLVTASRANVRRFQRATLLGRSLASFPASLRPRLYLRAENSGSSAQGLGQIYNEAIAALPNHGNVVFLHDDIYVHDWFLAQRIEAALTRFDLIGLVGCTDPEPDQPSATHTLNAQDLPTFARPSKSGALNHFDPHTVQPDDYGPAPASCGLLDGCFLACRLETLCRTGLRFDPQFTFHCYDGDFCRSARALGLSLGTWPIACTHGSPGGFDAQWVEAALRFRQKWCPSQSPGS